MRKLSPESGGCWYCETDGIDEWLTSFEFDCNLHRSCLEYQINNRLDGIENTELEVFMAEFEYYEDPHTHVPVSDENHELIYTKDNSGRKANICVFCRKFC